MKAADTIILALKNTSLSDFQEDHREFFSSTLLFINIPMEKALSHFRFNMEGTNQPRLVSVLFCSCS